MLPLALIGGAIVDQAGPALADRAGGFLSGLFGNDEKLTEYDDIKGKPSDAQVIEMLRRLTPVERQRLDAAYSAANPKANRTIEGDGPRKFAFETWGGTDGKVGSAEGRALQSLAVDYLRKYPLSGSVPPMPNNTTGQTIRETLGDLVDRSIDAVRGEVDQSIAEAAAPAVRATIQRRAANEWLPWIVAGGVALVLAVVLIRGK